MKYTSSKCARRDTISFLVTATKDHHFILSFASLSTIRKGFVSPLIGLQTRHPFYSVIPLLAEVVLGPLLLVHKRPPFYTVFASISTIGRGGFVYSLISLHWRPPFYSVFSANMIIWTVSLYNRWPLLP